MNRTLQILAVGILSIVCVKTGTAQTPSILGEYFGSSVNTVFNCNTPINNRTTQADGGVTIDLQQGASFFGEGTFSVFVGADEITEVLDLDGEIEADGSIGGMATSTAFVNGIPSGSGEAEFTGALVEDELTIQFPGGPLGIDNCEITGARIVVSREPGSEGVSYVALGDSYSSGEGAGDYFNGTDTDSNTCHRSRRAYSNFIRAPGRIDSIRNLAERGEPEFAWDFLACSAALTKNVRSGGSSPEKGADESPQLDALQAGVGPRTIVSESTDLITITIGGNDALFGLVVTLCSLAAIDCFDDDFFGAFDGLTLDEYLNALIPDVAERLRNLHAAIKLQAPNASFFVLGYPQLVAANTCGASLGLNINELLFIRNKTAVLNNAIATVAREVGVHFVSPEAKFRDHEVCGKRAPWIFGAFAEGAGEYHPTPTGQAMLAEVFETRVDELLAVANPGVFPSGFPRNPAAVQPVIVATASAASITEPLPGIGTLRVKPAFAPACDLGDRVLAGELVELRGEGFLPSSDVGLGLLSSDGLTRVTVSTVVATSTGQLDAQVALPAALDSEARYLIDARGTGSDGTGVTLFAAIEIGAPIDRDSDGDGLPDACDRCPSTVGGDGDADGDGIGDDCDVCPGDPENDADGDGLCFASDPCPGDADNDADSDGFCAVLDNCPLAFNPLQQDADGDGRGDACANEICLELDVDVVPRAGGMVRVSAPTCSGGLYEKARPLTLNADPEPGFFFTGWTGSIESLSATLAVAPSSDLTITANFCEAPQDIDLNGIGDLCEPQSITLLIGDKDGFGLGLTLTDIRPVSEELRFDERSTRDPIVTDVWPVLPPPPFGTPMGERTTAVEFHQSLSPVRATQINIRMLTTGIQDGDSQVAGSDFDERMFIDGFEIPNAFDTVDQFEFRSGVGFVQTVGFVDFDVPEELLGLFEDGEIDIRIEMEQLGDANSGDGFAIDFIELEVVAIPEPRSLILHGVALVAVWVVSLLRRRGREIQN